MYAIWNDKAGGWYGSRILRTLSPYRELSIQHANNLQKWYNPHHTLRVIQFTDNMKTQTEIYRTIPQVN